LGLLAVETSMRRAVARLGGSADKSRTKSENAMLVLNGGSKAFMKLRRRSCKAETGHVHVYQQGQAAKHHVDGRL
jgi:hypothetical protein